MIMQSTSRDKIERSAVIDEPVPSIMDIGCSTIVAAQVRMRSGPACQSVQAMYRLRQGYSAAARDSASGRTI
jgi:hypothetical protein